MMCCISLTAQITKTIQVQVSNTSTVDRVDKPVVLKIDELDLGFVPKSAVVMSGATEIPSQLDDLTGNRKADELAFVIDVIARGKRTLDITFSRSEERRVGKEC